MLEQWVAQERARFALCHHVAQTCTASHTQRELRNRHTTTPRACGVPSKWRSIPRPHCTMAMLRRCTASVECSCHPRSAKAAAVGVPSGGACVAAPPSKATAASTQRRLSVVNERALAYRPPENRRMSTGSSVVGTYPSTLSCGAVPRCEYYAFCRTQRCCAHEPLVRQLESKLRTAIRREASRLGLGTTWHTTESMDDLLAGGNKRGPRQACGTYERGAELRAFNGSKVMGGARIGVDFTGPGQLAQAAIHRARRETPSRGK